MIGSAIVVRTHAVYTRPVRWVIGAAIATAGCFGTSGGPAPSVDPLGGAECPAEHLSLAARALSFDADPRIVRFDRELRSCRGLVLRDVNETLWVVGGTPDGSELLGFEGRLMRVRDREVIWDLEEVGVALDLFHASIGGAPHVVVLWGNTSGFADRLDVRDLQTGSVTKSYDVSSTIVGAAPSADRVDRLVLLDQYDGFSEVHVDLSADALGGASELEVLAPRGVGSAGAIAVGPGRVAIATDDGILHWTPETPAMLGPASCRWPRWTGETLPEACEHRGVAFDRSAGGDFLTVCHAPDRTGVSCSASRAGSCACATAR